MILDLLKHSGTYFFSEDLQKGIEFLKENDFDAMEDGEYEIGDGVFAIVSEYSTKDAEDCKPESHRKYVDIQYLHCGEENIGWAPLGDQKVLSEYNEASDVVFFDCETQLFKLSAKMFAVFYPGDIHQPGIMVSESSKVKKVVVKIPF